MSFIRTFRGHDVNLLAPKPDTIDITDIAHHLALTNRFNGATPLPYSVAQHSVHVLQEVERRGGTPEQCLAGLLHDAQEAYFGDIVRPVKRIVCGMVYEDVTETFDAALARRFGLASLADRLVRLADDALLAAEWIDFGFKGPPPVSVPRAGFAIKPWRWDVAEDRFRCQFDLAFSRLTRRTAFVTTGIIK